MKGREFLEEYDELKRRNDNFIVCINALYRLNLEDPDDIKVATESMAIIEEKQAVVLLKMSKLENMNVIE